MYFNLFFALWLSMTVYLEANAASCNGPCHSGFGVLVGQSFLTKAYSNCNDDCVKNENHYVAVPYLKKPVLTGMKWQCVEYARRWLIENKGVTFGDVEYAYHIWDLPYAEKLDTHEQLPLLQFKNKLSKVPPKVGDLLINSVKLAVTGHVSVVVGVDSGSITIAEQNYFNRAWENEHYARRLLLSRDDHGRYRVYDDALIGWVRVKSS